MDPTRIWIAVAAAFVLLLLTLFSQYRWQQVAECQARGGVWDGPDSKCRLIPRRIFIERDLKRI